MAVETELKLRLPASALKKVAAHPLLAATPPDQRRLHNVYYDTPRLDLLHSHFAVRHRQVGWQWLLTVKAADQSSGGLAQRREWEVPCSPGSFDFSHVDDSALRQQLDRLAAELQPAFRTDFTRRRWIISPWAGCRVEVALDHGQIESGQQRLPICELELELLEGEPVDLFRLCLVLSEATRLHPEPASKAERGYRLFTGSPLSPRRAGILPLDSDTPAVDAFRIIAGDCLAHMQGNEAGVVAGDDPEFIHQARVAIRRLRAALKFFSPHLPEGFAAAWNAQWRDLAAALGEARNWDVFSTEILPPLLASFPDHTEVRWLGQHSKRQRQAAQKHAVAALTSPDYSHLLLDFGGALWSLPPSPRQETLANFAHKRLLRRQRQLGLQLARLAELSIDERHLLRIACKKLRYALEFLPLDPRRGHGKSLRNALMQAQDLLGELNDLATAQQLTHQRPGGFIAGWLAGRSDQLMDNLPEALRPLHKQLKPVTGSGKNSRQGASKGKGKSAEGRANKR